MGFRWGQVFLGEEVIHTINECLKALGVQAIAGQDEFDTVGLGKYSVSPDYLEKYDDLSVELGV